LRFMKIEDLEHCFKTDELCVACFDGSYTTSLFSYKEIITKQR